MTTGIMEMARAAGASLVGVAPVERFDGAPTGHNPGELLPGARSVVVFGVRILDRVLEWPDLLQGSSFFAEDLRLEALNSLFYKRSGYDIINDRLNQIALTLANRLEDDGHNSLFFPSVYGDQTLGGRLPVIPAMLSLRHAAVRAGLGEFGLNNVVVTERYGPRIRFNAVITAAQLEPSPLSGKVCLGAACGKCLDECRPAALGQASASDERVVWLNPVSRTDWATCRAKRVEMGCMGRCLRVCPVGR